MCRGLLAKVEFALNLTVVVIVLAVAVVKVVSLCPLLYFINA